MDLTSFTDLDIVARTICGEADDQTFDAKQGVGSVIVRRAAMAWQGETTARGVCLHRKQFDCWLPGPDLVRITSPAIINDPSYNDCLSIAEKVLDGTLPDNTLGSDSYENTDAGAYWARGLTPTIVINDLSFYKTR